MEITVVFDDPEKTFVWSKVYDGPVPEVGDYMEHVEPEGTLQGKVVHRSFDIAGNAVRLKATLRGMSK